MPFVVVLALLAHPNTGEAMYLGNAGVLVVDADAAVVFDPLFRRDFNRYERVPAKLEGALMSGAPPFSTLNAVFVSHYHEDHFSPELLVQLLKRRPEVHLFAPEQAIAQLRQAGGTGLETRLHSVALDYGEKAYRETLGPLEVEAVRIPHSGWPDRMRIVQNIAFRVTLNRHLTVIHLGDATDVTEPFARHREHWRARSHHLALPPYWFFDSSGGRAILTEELRPGQSVGVHVPKSFSDDPKLRRRPYRKVDLFTRPGETRRIQH